MGKLLSMRWLYYITVVRTRISFIKTTPIYVIENELYIIKWAAKFLNKYKSVSNNEIINLLDILIVAM